MTLQLDIYFKKLFLLASISTIFSVALIILGPQTTHAAYDGGRIIDNTVFLDARSMNANDIQNFLASKGGQIASRSFILDCDAAGSQAKQGYLSQGAPCGQTIPASQIIYYSAQVYGISPKVILATLQKEQSLVTAVNPTDRQYSQAMGYACPTSGSCNSSSNFFYQIDNGTWVLRFHMERARGNNSYWVNSTSWTCGTEKNFYKPNLYPNQNVSFYDEDGVMYRTHFISNAATSSMYCYTPHAYNNPQGLYGRAAFGTIGRYYSGSYNFVQFFETWFGSTQTNVPYAWKLQSQEAYTDASRTIPFTSTITVRPGGKIYMRATVQNFGFEVWNKGQINLGASRPNDRTSIFYDETWLTSKRAASITNDVVRSGETTTIDFILKAPTETGSYKEYFNMVAEGKTWLNDIGMYYDINVVSPASPMATIDNVLASGEDLKINNRIMSQDTQSILAFQPDGNLVVYSNFTAPIWSSMSAGKDGKSLVMQEDGNLVIYSSTNVPIWNSGTGGNAGARLVLQTDGNLVIYSSTNVPIWSINFTQVPDHLSYVNTELHPSALYPNQSLETANRKYKFVLQTDSNLVLYSNSQPIWNSGTSGRNAAYLVLQPDGNLVLYDANGFALWHTNTFKGGISKLAIQPDGNLVLYNSVQSNWSTNTSGK